MSRTMFACVAFLSLVAVTTGIARADFISWQSPLGFVSHTESATIEPAAPGGAVTITAGEAGLGVFALGLVLSSDDDIDSLQVCYQTSGVGTYISQTRLNRMTTPNTALVILDDPTDRVDSGPTCYRCGSVVHETSGTITLMLFVEFSGPDEWIMIGGIGVLIEETFSSVGDSQQLGTEHSILRANAPNPFNPSTAIEYEMPKADRIELQIYDLSGRVVRTLVEGQQAAGIHRVNWDGRDDESRPVPAGKYYYQIRMGDRVDSRGMVLIR